MKKHFAVAALCLSASAMANMGHDFSYTVAANVTPFNPLDINVTLTVRDGKVSQLAAMNASGQTVWSETIDTPCKKFAARAGNHARMLENTLSAMESKIADKSEAAMNRATLDSYEGGIKAEQATMNECQKSASPSPAKDYQTATGDIDTAKRRLQALRVLIPAS